MLASHSRSRLRRDIETQVIDDEVALGTWLKIIYIRNGYIIKLTKTIKYVYLLIVI